MRSPYDQYSARLPVTSSAAAAPSSSRTSSLSLPPSLSRQRSSVPSELQSALSDLLSLHSQIDSALLRLESCASLAALSAASLEVKQRIAQLQQRIVAVQAEVEQQQSAQHERTAPHKPHQQQSYVHRPRSDDDDVHVAAAAHAVPSGRIPSVGVAGITGGSPSVDPYESFHQLLAQHSMLANSYSNTLRQRLLACRAQLAARSQAVRRELFSSSTHSSAQPAASLSTSQAAADRQRQFTASLHHTHTLLQSSLSLSAASLSSLTSSTDSLVSTARQSELHSEAVKGGSKIITKQMQRQRTDRVLVWCGLAFFLLVCVYITNRRLRISRIIAFVTRTLVPNMNWYSSSGETARQQQWTEQSTEELSHTQL